MPGCAVCKLMLRDVERFIDSLLYEYSNSEEMRAVFSASRGLCSEHGHLMRYNKQGNVLAIAKLYRATLADVLKNLADGPGRSETEPRTWAERWFGSGSRVNNAPIADRLEATENCVACDVMAVYESECVQMFQRYIGESRFRQAFEESEGLCLPHFRTVVRALTDPGDSEAFIESQCGIWRRLYAELELFIEKQNYEHIGEPIGDEGDSWVRAILRMAGERGVFGVRR